MSGNHFAKWGEQNCSFREPAASCAQCKFANRRFCRLFVLCCAMTSELPSVADLGLPTQRAVLEQLRKRARNDGFARRMRRYRQRERNGEKCFTLSLNEASVIEALVTSGLLDGRKVFFEHAEIERALEKFTRIALTR